MTASVIPAIAAGQVPDSPNIRGNLTMEQSMGESPIRRFMKNNIDVEYVNFDLRIPIRLNMEGYSVFILPVVSRKPEILIEGTQCVLPVRAINIEELLQSFSRLQAAAETEGYKQGFCKVLIDEDKKLMSIGFFVQENNGTSRKPY